MPITFSPNARRRHFAKVGNAKRQSEVHFCEQFHRLRCIISICDEAATQMPWATTMETVMALSNTVADTKATSMQVLMDGGTGVESEVIMEMVVKTGVEGSP